MQFVFAALVLLSRPIFGGAFVRIEVPDPCPETFRGWVALRSDLANRWAACMDNSGDTLGAWAAERLESLKACRKKRLALFAKNPGIDACWSDLVGALQTVSQFRGEGSSPARKLGMNVPDEEYYRKTSLYTEVPSDIKNNQAFLQAVSRLKTMNEAYAELERMNELRKAAHQPKIEYVRFTGNVPASASGSMERLLLYIPGNPEKWFSLGLANEKGIRSPQFSAIAVHDGAVYFKDHWRLYRNGRVRFEDVKEGKFSDACWKCHKSGVLTLSMKLQHGKTDEELGKVARFNAIMRSHGVLSSAGYYEPEKLGAGWGGDPQTEPGLRELREKLLPYCVAKTVQYGDNRAFEKKWSALDRGRLMRAMSCSRCHDGVSRGRLTVPFGNVLSDVIDSGRMPPGMRLSHEEKSILKICLNLEFTGLITDEERNRIAGQGSCVSGGGPESNGIRGLELKTSIFGRMHQWLTATACRPDLSPEEPGARAVTPGFSHAPGR